MQIYANEVAVARGMISWWVNYDFGQDFFWRPKQAMLNMLKIMLIFLTLSLERLMRNFFFFFFKKG
jgi:hypothetical protein